MNRLRMIREQCGISQRDLGKAAGMSATAISRYETGERKLTVETAKRIATVLEADWVALFEPPGQQLHEDSEEGEQKVEQ